MPQQRSSKRGPILFVAVLLGLVATGWVAATRSIAGPEWAADSEGVPVRRGNLRVSEVARGNLEAKDSARLVNEVEGRATILFLVEEGTQVLKGDLICELDVSGVRDRRLTQEITVKKYDAGYTKAREEYDIQEIQNKSDIADAALALRLAKMDLEKFVSEQGEWTHELSQAEEAIKLSQEELKQSEETLRWTQDLHEKGFVQGTELERDQLAKQRAEIKVTQAKREQRLLENYEYERRLAELEAAVETAERDLRKVEKQARAKLADGEAARESARFKLERERVQLAKYDDQILKSKMYAPESGMLVYSRSRASHRGEQEVPHEGVEVRERQVIATIPRDGGTIAQASLHETVLARISQGQSCLVTIDAVPGRAFRGELSYVAAVADSGSWRTNPNQRLYRTEVSLIDEIPEVRPGMSCDIEILIDQRPDTLFVPRRAIQLDGERTICFVVRDGAAIPTEVEVGADNEQSVEILSGLEEGQLVMLRTPKGWEPAPTPPASNIQRAFEDPPGSEPASPGPAAFDPRNASSEDGKSVDAERAGAPQNARTFGPSNVSAR